MTDIWKPLAETEKSEKKKGVLSYANLSQNANSLNGVGRAGLGANDQHH
jgi:hypothetical protein